MPIPESRTSMTALSPDSFRRTSTRPPRGVNLMALESRFQITCCKRSLSPSTGLSRAVRETTRSIALASAAGRALSRAASMMRASSTGLSSRRSVPARRLLEDQQASPLLLRPLPYPDLLLQLLVGHRQLGGAALDQQLEIVVHRLQGLVDPAQLGGALLDFAPQGHLLDGIVHRV